MPEKQRFLWLDGLRGLAAIAVMILHISDHAPIAPYFRSAYLAVDLFFAMSGFVIAHAYEQRMRAGVIGFWRFVHLRLIRLYPLYLAAMVLGLGWYVARFVLGWPETPDASSLAFDFALNALYLPSFSASPPDLLYPFSPFSWTLFWELMVNFAYGAILYRLGTGVLLALTLLGLVVLALAVWHYDAMSIGWAPDNFLGGAARAWFFFCCGVILLRLAGDSRLRGPLLFFPAMATSLALFVLLPEGKPWWAFAAAVIVIPLVVAGLPRTEPKAGLNRLCDALGRVSYPLYILHWPLILIWLALARLIIEPGSETISPWLWWVFGPLAVGISYAAAVLFDEPVRRWLRRRAVRHEMVEELGSGARRQ